MKQLTVALVEFGGSHDECILTQLEALQTANASVILVTNLQLYDRNPQWHELIKAVYFIEPTGKALKDLGLMRRLVKYLEQNGVSKVVFNTAQGGHVRNLSFLLPKSIRAYGIIHTIRKFQGSFTQKIIHRKIKRYVVLSDDLLQHVAVPKGISLRSFYPVSFPNFHQKAEKPIGEHWITITGGVENRRKDLDAVIGFIQATGPEIHFVFLGKTDINHPDAQAFLRAIEIQGLTDRVRYFTDFVDHAVFDAYLQQTDFLLPLIHPDTPSADEYINHQISGAFTIAFGYKIPLLIHEAYRTEQDLTISAAFYQSSAFTEGLKTAFSLHERIHQQIGQEEKWTKPYQYRNYLRFLELVIN
ncbi:MAG: hypothetical protein A3D31_13670 [Candidatus Fluviicola riflensis]|nr:MAG: hypothetical protein CHH17_18105 [Candidatus Fluviicola riflensis]OGS78026.1 MAG: hypothetical protein A3D31_13670 [Candidatus Fluviicola riflensis]OGS85091.1 MAG: hypothetical protein A2724_10605 [Fluviicola sp. RIFCSPHIGHO2_01_FULL_43_53]OGS89363.1 MAG: hypothetical protein A3E30_04910 [Fluviicola sp. RIFCSPHIGHO2_12_FULL_43_24]